MTPDAEEWLAFQVATTYGLDKAPMHERMQWVAENDEVISARRTRSTIGNIHLMGSC